MNAPAIVRVVAFSPASPADRRTGLLGWVVLEIASILRLSVAVRRTLRGRLSLSFPERTDPHGKKHDVARPVHDGARRQIEREVFAALGMSAEADA